MNICLLDSINVQEQYCSTYLLKLAYSLSALLNIAPKLFWLVLDLLKIYYSSVGIYHLWIILWITPFISMNTCAFVISWIELLQSSIECDPKVIDIKSTTVLLRLFNVVSAETPLARISKQKSELLRSNKNCDYFNL